MEVNGLSSHVDVILSMCQQEHPAHHELECMGWLAGQYLSPLCLAGDLTECKIYLQAAALGELDGADGAEAAALPGHPAQC